MPQDSFEDARLNLLWHGGTALSNPPALAPKKGRGGREGERSEIAAWQERPFYPAGVSQRHSGQRSPPRNWLKHE